MFLEFNWLFEPLCVNRLKGSTLADRLAMSNTVSPGVNSILSRISSRFSSGIAFRDVLFVEYTALMYHVLPAGIRFVVRFQRSDTLSISPSSDAFIVTVLAFSPCATENSNSSFVRVVGFMVIIPPEVTAPWLFIMLSGSVMFMPFIVTVSVGEGG